MEKRITIKDIARETGVHYATVSRALRNDPCVANETLELIRKAAAKLGYKPDPMLSALAAYRSSKNPVTYKETLAFLWPELKPARIESDDYLQRYIRGARKRAEERGYKIDEFSLQEIGPRTFRRVLEARGIRGVVISAHVSISAAHLRFKSDDLAIATMSASLKAPRLHRSEHDHYAAMIIALHHLKKRGFSRIMFINSEKHERVLEKRYTAAFVTHHPLGMATALDLLVTVPVIDQSSLQKAVRKCCADCVLMKYSPADFCRLEVGKKQIPLFSLDLLPNDKRFSGINQRMEIVAANAVDLVIEQLTSGQFGVPKFPKVIYDPGFWQDNEESTGGIKSSGLRRRYKIGVG